MNGKQLKNSILQWAIQGKLVPQDPNDEPASVLLEKIRAEKARLVKEGKLKKKDLEVKPIAEDEIPFEIPESWVWVRFSEVFVFNPRNVCDDNSDAGYIPMSYIEADLQNRFRFDVKKWKDVKNGLTHLSNGDIAFAKITPCITNLKSAIMHDLPNGIAGGTTELNVFRVIGETMDRKYILYFHASSYFMKEAAYKGTAGQQRIISDYVLNKPFPLPPLAEQHRIVAKIEELMPLVEKYGAAQDALNEWNQALPEKLKKSILQEAYFGNHVGIPLSETQEVKLKDVCDIIMGQSPEGNTYNNSNGIEFHQGKVAFGNMFLNPSGVYTTSPTKYAEPDSIVVSVRAPVGTANITKRKICIGRGLACIIPKQNADLMYIYYLLESPEIREYLEDNATGTTFKAISGKVLQELELTFPPLAEQRCIVAKIEELFGIINKNKDE